MTGAARELSGPKDDPRSSRSRFRGCRRNSQIHRPPGHAVILSMMGWQLQDSNLPAPRIWPREEYTQQVLTREAVSATSPAAIPV
jgi:hypothetical protein